MAQKSVSYCALLYEGHERQAGRVEIRRSLWDVFQGDQCRQWGGGGDRTRSLPVRKPHCRSRSGHQKSWFFRNILLHSKRSSLSFKSQEGFQRGWELSTIIDLQVFALHSSKIQPVVKKGKWFWPWIGVQICCADLGEECDCGEDEEHCYDPCCFPARVLVSDKENDPERVVWVNGEKKTKPSKRLSCTRHTLPRFVLSVLRNKNFSSFSFQNSFQLTTRWRF